MLDLGDTSNEYGKNLQRFMEYVISRHRETDYFLSFGPNCEAKALFSAIQEAFVDISKGMGLVVAHNDLVSNIAACAMVALDYDKNQNIPWDKADHDYIVRSTLRGFVATIVNAINAGQVKQRKNGDIFFGCFPVPDWFIVWAQSWSWSCWYEVAEIQK